MKTRVNLFFFLSFLGLFLLAPQASQANNLTITNVRMGTRDVAAKNLTVFFDVSWENSWKNKINHDAVWLTLRLNDTQAPSSEKKLCSLTTAGLNPNGSGSGTNADVEIYVPADKVGAFVRRAANNPTASMSSKNVMLTVNYDSCGFNESSQIAVTVFGLEMVYIPEGSYYAGDFSASNASLHQGSADVNPWHIANENSLNVTNAASGGYYYVSAGNPGESQTGAAFVIPDQFPKGYKSFYAMKYEITEGDWAVFVNSLSPAARIHRDLTDNLHKNSDAVLSRNTLACSGSPLLCVSQRPSRALTFLGWQDLSAFLDWAGLRPMTELEFEKTARGPFIPFKNEYAWGSSNITAAQAISGTSEENSNETVITPSANANFNNVVFSGGDSGLGSQYQSGPLRGGIFATTTTTREQSGAGDFGAMELSGNVKEQVVSIGNPAALLFTGQQGDGNLTTASGFEGNANVSGWPGMDVDVSKGVTGDAGSGRRGGSFADAANLLRISDRTEAALMALAPDAFTGGRGVRTYDGP
ncbi:MAG: SUMF1/EgtB/PvdO family nonheme iron enzyme [Candidatus Omnitrophica bacterium]|nr:SUMF1/EgtB/PvdO family nonheme iron enzyme [Candidatus Omnitrophota bacterium]